MMTARSLAVAAIAAILAACGGSDSTPPPPTPPTPTVTINGIVATGAPLTFATMTIRCGNTYQDIFSANSDGSFGVNVPEGSTPCILRATGGQDPVVLLYGIARTPGYTNVTPLTTLATAHAMMMSTGMTSFSQFFAQGAIDLPALVAELDDTTAILLGDLDAAGFTFPAGFDPLGDRFAAVPGDWHDYLLEQLDAALVDDGQTLDAFVASWLGGGDFPEAPEVVGDGPTDPDAIAALAGTYDVEFVYTGAHTRGTVIIGADNSVDFDNGRVFSDTDADAAIVYDWIACCNRVDVDYGAAGYLRLSVTEEGDLRDVYLDLASADVAVTFFEQLDEGTSDGSLLEGNGIIGTVDNVLRVQQVQETQEDVPPFLTSADGRFTLSGAEVPLVWTLIGVPGELGVHYCSPIQNGVGITFHASPTGEAGGAIGRVGRCTVTVTSVTLDTSGNVTSVEGHFAVELLSRTGSYGSTSGNDVEIVTDGYFRFEP